MDEPLQISPLELKFRFELRKQIPATLRLYNPADAPVAFKVKTTSPKKYCVRPNTGIVAPHATVEVMVIMQVQKEVPANPSQIKDKFLVQSVPLPADTPSENPSQEFLADIFTKEKAGAGQIMETKLKVSYTMPNNPPSSVPEDREVDMDEPPEQISTPPAALPTTSDSKYENAMASLTFVTKEKNVADGEAKRLRAELDKLQAKVQELESKPAVDTKPASKAKPAKVSGLVVGFTLIHLLITAIVAFLLGRYT